MRDPTSQPLRRARVLGPGLVVTLQDPLDTSRIRVRVLTRQARTLRVQALAGAGVTPNWEPGRRLDLRAARPFGLFVFQTRVVGPGEDGSGVLDLEAAPARRKQSRSYFRMPVRLGVMLEARGEDGTSRVLQARNLSGSGILLLDSERRLSPQGKVRLGLPIGSAGEMLRVQARVVRVTDENPRRAALCFEGISLTERQMLLRFLVREYRRRRRNGRAAMGRILSIERP